MVRMHAKSQKLRKEEPSLLSSLEYYRGSDPRILRDRRARVMNLEGGQGCTKKSLTDRHSLRAWAVNTKTNATHPQPF